MVTQHTKHKHARLKMACATLCLALFGTGCVLPPLLVVKNDGGANTAPVTTSKPNPLYDTSYSKKANVPFVDDSGQVKFKSESASRRTRDMAEWVVQSGDNRGLPFAIIDKVNAKVYAFDRYGRLYEAAPVLLGLAKGDYSTPGIGNKPLSQIPPSERTTPAGRFVAAMGRNHKGKDILWVDYNESLSLHAVVRGTVRDRRAERLASPTSKDNRISFGCINVPKPFFYNVIRNKFSGTKSVVYILPETKKFRKT
jgi:hypothetical protein